MSWIPFAVLCRLAKGDLEPGTQFQLLVAVDVGDDEAARGRPRVTPRPMNCEDGARQNANDGGSRDFLCMDHGSQRFWFGRILHCLKNDFFGEALQRSEI
jgi:hypothetical protein